MVDSQDYTLKTREELIKVCKDLGLKGYSSKTKSGIIEIILSTKHTTRFPTPQYLGSKTKYVHYILDNIPKEVKSVFDAFSGSGVVSFTLKENGYHVISNDILSYNSMITKALIENQTITLSEEEINMLMKPNALKDDFIEREFSGLYYNREECVFLDNLYANIQKLDDEYKKAIVFTSIGRTLIRKILFAYFCHTKAMTYRQNEKHWKRNPAINEDIQKLFNKYLQEYNSIIFDNQKPNKSHNSDIFILNTPIQADLVYIDPPYGGMHIDYGGYYHFIETYINYWKHETLYNTTKQPKNKLPKSKFASKTINLALEDLFEKFAHIKYWMISYNSNAKPSKDVLIKIIEKYKKNIEIKEITLTANNGGMGLRKNSKEFLFICS